MAPAARAQVSRFRSSRTAWLLALLALLTLPLATGAETTSREPTSSALPLPTRLVAEFAEKEAALARALAKGDKAAAMPLVDQDFELIASPDLGQSASFEALFDEAAKHPQRILSARELSARDIGETTLVSFYWDEQEPATKRHTTWVVLDAWKLGPDGWKLKTRFISPRGNPKIYPPGYSPGGAVIEKRY